MNSVNRKKKKSDEKALTRSEGLRSRVTGNLRGYEDNGGAERDLKAIKRGAGKGGTDGKARLSLVRKPTQCRLLKHLLREEWESPLPSKSRIPTTPCGL